MIAAEDISRIGFARDEVSAAPLVAVLSPCRWADAAQRSLFERYCVAAMRDCLRLGEHPYASHLLLAFGAQVLNDEDGHQRAAGMACGIAWEGRADHVAVYQDLGVSEGMRLSIAVARARGQAVVWRRLGPPWGAT